QAGAYLQAFPYNQQEYSWLKDGVIISSGTNSYYSYNVTPGNYQVIVEDIFGCSDTSKAVFASAGINLIPPAIEIQGDTLVSSTASTYQWFRGDNPIDGATNKNHSPPVAGSYSVAVTNDQNCVASSTIEYDNCAAYNPSVVPLYLVGSCLSNELEL